MIPCGVQPAETTQAPLLFTPTTALLHRTLAYLQPDTLLAMMSFLQRSMSPLWLMPISPIIVHSSSADSTDADDPAAAWAATWSPARFFISSFPARSLVWWPRRAMRDELIISG